MSHLKNHCFYCVLLKTEKGTRKMFPVLTEEVDIYLHLSQCVNVQWLMHGLAFSYTSIWSKTWICNYIRNDYGVQLLSHALNPTAIRITADRIIAWMYEYK